MTLVLQNFLLSTLISCRFSSTVDQMIDGFGNKMVGCCPLVSQTLAPETAEPWLPKTVFCRQLLLSKKKRLILWPKLIRLWWCLSHTTHYVQQQAGSLLRFSKGQGLVPCATVLINAYFEAFHLRLPELQALITLTTPIRSRSAASPLFNQQLAWGTGTENTADGCEASEGLQQVVLRRQLYHHS